MRRISWLLAAAAVLSLALVAVGTAGTAKKQAGTLVFGAEQEPPCLFPETAGCNNTWTTWTSGISFRGAYVQQPDFSFKPDIIDGDATVTTKPQFTLTYHIKKNANWSDGVPVTADDFIFDWKFHIDPKVDIASRAGYDQIQRAVKINAKTVKFIFKTPFAPWKTIFGALYPAHVLQGQDLNTVWNTNVNDPKTGKPVGNGPYLVTKYVKGQQIELTANPKWYGAKPKLSKIIFKFVTNTDSEVQAIKGGEVDAIYPQPQLQLADLKSTPGLAVQSNSGAIYEHLDFNAGAKGFQLARAPWFRQAFSYAIDRSALVKQLYATLNSKLGTLNSLVYVNNQTGLYKPDFARYTYNPAKVAQIMQAKGCKKGSDGIFVCNGIRASIKFSTTAGNKLRELGQEIMQAQAKKAGIELVIANSPSSVLFPAVANLDYQLVDFAWSTTGDPVGANDIYGCGGGSNWMAYCSKAVTDTLKASNSELDPTKRAALVNKADAIMALNVPSLPLYQKPTYFVYKAKIKGMVDNPTSAGPVWNVENWSMG